MKFLNFFDISNFPKEYELIEKMLMRHEGLRLVPYLDSKGILTIGYGRNLIDYGITKEEADYLGIPDNILRNLSSLKISESAARYLLQNNIIETDELLKTLPWFLSLNDARKDAIIDMVYNLGYRKFSGFKRAIDYLIDGEPLLSAKEILNSKYAKQDVPKRAKEISEMVRLGRYLNTEELSMIWH